MVKTMSKNNTYNIPEYITATDLKQLRKKLNMTQKEFAGLIGSSKPTVERWESSDKKITGPIVLLAKMLDEQPEYVEKIRIPEKIYPMRLYYMHNNNLCTIIDVDELREKIQIKNFTNHRMFRAFGVNTEPTYEEYQEFIESRCFPRSRDKMKLILKDLNLPFYDPIMIIEKTEGRMAEDDFWIRIER